MHTFETLQAAPPLATVFGRIRDRLATMDRNVNRDEEILPDVSLLVLLKILDELSHRSAPKAPLAFQVGTDPGSTARRVRDLLDAHVARHPELYAVADAFQVIRGKAYKGEEGQYFTPRSVVRVAIAAVAPGPEDRIIDPACGSGSFLATALESVLRQLEVVHGRDRAALDRARREWSSRQVHALDKDSVSVRLAKAYLSMLGGGGAQVCKSDAIRTRRWPESLAAAVVDGTFDVVVTNPPFGTKLKVSAAAAREEGYELAATWARKDGGWASAGGFTERDLGLLFLERSMRLLRPGGRLAIVLPDTYLFSESYAWLVAWLSRFTITHSINVPIEAFEPHCRAKTSVLVLRKEPPPQGHRIIGSCPETFGEDKHGRPRCRFVDGRQTEDRDDEMAEAAALLEAGVAAAESRLYFHFRQDEAVRRGVLVASYWWRAPQVQALDGFAASHGCDVVPVGDLVDAGELEVLDGHGSPSPHSHGRGTVPYVKVVDIKNWRVIENPKYAIPEDIAARYRRGKVLQPWDLVTPTRASKNIGCFGVVMPWQTRIVLTREIAIWRVRSGASRVTPWLLLALASLHVVHDQFRFLVLMQMNREDLGRRYRELLLPIPRDAAMREKWARPIQDYFEVMTRARERYEALAHELDPTLFVERP
jgi:type I restriction enzyme M protein